MSELEDLRAEVKELRLAKGPALFTEMMDAVLARAEAAEAKVAEVEALLDEHWLNPVNFLPPVASVLTAVQKQFREAVASVGRAEPAPEAGGFEFPPRRRPGVA